MMSASGNLVPDGVGVQNNSAVGDFQETVHFTESQTATAPSLSSPEADNIQVVPNQDISDFLSRPVEIATYDWASTDTTDSVINQFNPWSTFLANAAVKNKLANFQLVRGDLHIRVLINGTPFHYGALIVWYHPYAYNDTTGSHSNIHTCIQHPGLILYPAGNTSVDLVLPFVSQRKWIDLSPTGYTGNVSIARGDNLGSLNATVLSPLVNANTVAATNINVTIMAWMTNAHVAVPTPYPILEAKHSTKKKKRVVRQTEYEDTGSVSKVASTVADIAGRLTDVPVIGAFARATEVGADAVGYIASLFGWSKPTVATNTTLVKSVAYGYFAQSQGVDASHKLTLDPKNEVTIDPRVVGLEPQDSMLFGNILNRESLQGVFSWDPTDAQGTELARYYVTPGWYEYVTAGTQAKVIKTTPLFWLSRAFAYWTGTIVYKIRIIATQYHRGRLRVVYFPRDAAILPSVDYSNTTWNTIIDVSQDEEVEFVVPWTQAQPWLPTTRIPSDAVASLGVTNGTLAFFVVNELSTPTGTGSVEIVVTATGGEDLRFAKPFINQIQNLSPYIPTKTTLVTIPSMYTTGKPTQLSSGYLPMGDNVVDWTTGALDVVLESGISLRKVQDNTGFTSEHFGETVVSLRSLLKRPCIYYEAKTASSAASWRRTDYFLPYAPMDPLALTNGVAAIADYPMAVNTGVITGSDIGGYNTFLSYFRAGFLAMRGSMRYKVQFGDYGGPASDFRSFGDQYAALTAGVGPYVQMRTMPYSYYDTGNGAMLNAKHYQDGMEAEVPYYYPWNFVLATTRNDPSFGMGTDSTDHFDPNGIVFSNPHSTDTATGGNPIERTATIFASAGEDFTLDWFIAAPLLVLFDGTVGRPEGEDSPPA